MNAKILVVDDDEGIREMLILRLQKIGHRVVVAGSGSQALDVLADEKVDLVLLDQMMPQMDGLETFEGLKKKITSPPPVIMMTAHSSLNLALAFMKAGGTDFIQKPLDIEVLDVTLLEGGMKLAYEKVSIQQIIADLSPDFAQKARAKSLKLRVSLADDLPPVRSDRKRLSRIFSNLLDNAIKFTETGAVELKAGEKENSVLISISDTGLGIPETELPHIFDGFSQIDRSGARPGIGLGLFICKKLTDLMDGELRVESEIGRGCIFYLSLPKWKDQ